MMKMKKVPLWVILLILALPHMLLGAGMNVAALNPSEKKTVQGSAADESVTLTIIERAGVPRSDAYVSFGVPLPKSWGIAGGDGLRLTEENGAAVPAQFHVLDRWGGPSSDVSLFVKWVLIGVKVSVPAGGELELVLKKGGPGPLPPESLTFDDSVAGKLTVDTGVAQFELLTQGAFNLFNRVTLGDKNILETLPGAEAVRYEPAGERDIVAGGTPNTVSRTTSVSIERRGPLSAVVKAVGSIHDDSSRPIFDYTARLFFVAGSTEVRVDFTVENNHPVMEGEWGQPVNVHDQGAINSVYLGGLKLGIQPAMLEADLLVTGEEGVSAVNPDAPVRLYQDASGTQYWDAYVGPVGWEGISAHPRLQSFCSREGFEITGPGILKQGSRSMGWMASGGQETRVMVAVRDFARNFPKAIQVGTGGRLEVDLFPAGDVFNHNLRVGEEKTHSLLFHFSDGPAEGNGGSLASAFNTPLIGSAPAAWYPATGVLGDVPEKDLSQWPLYERFVDTAFQPNPAMTPEDDQCCGNTTLKEVIERYNLYGWQDYGDVPLDYEGFGDNQAGQMNLKYWYLNGMLVQYCRSGDPRWLDLALPAARHISDIDFLHIPDTGIGHWAHGAYFGHSSHDEPGNSNPNRNYNSPSTDLLFGIPDLLLAYRLTGETRFLDVAREGLDGMANLHGLFMNSAYPVFYRERANLIFAYMEGYRQTGESRFLDLMREIVGNTADLSNKGWLADPNAYVPPPGGPEGESERVSGFQVGQVLWTLGRYLDFADEYGLSDDLGVGGALTAYGDFIITHLMKEIPAHMRENEPGNYPEETLDRYAGRFATIDSIWFTAPFETYLEVNNWALLMADVLTYAYRHSKESRFLNAASQLYETGTTDTVWLDDPPVYIASKDLVNSLNWGLVYMNETGTPVTPGEVPEAPVLTVTREGGTLTLSWSRPAGASGYTLYYAPVETLEVESIPMENRNEISAPLWETPSFYIAVQAYNEAGTGEFSNVEQIP